MIETASRTEIVLDVLYLDGDGCDPCRTTIASVDEVSAVLDGPLRDVGRTLTVNTIHVTDREQAHQLGFVSSPTVRVDGVDIELGLREQSCASCSTLADEPIDCRTFDWQGVTFPSPPAEMIASRVLQYLDGALPVSPATATVPEQAADATSVDRFVAARIAQATRAAALRRRMRGTVLSPSDDGYDTARATFTTIDDQRPALIAVPNDVDDVVVVVNFAREHGLRVVPQRTGHNASPLGDIAGTVLVRTDAMREVVIDTERRIARVGAGAKWEDVVPQAAQPGLAAPHGSTPEVSVAGYASGGGVGWHGGKYGPAANSIIAIEVVTADGRLRRVDHEYGSELFWALRGGRGGNFGVITAVEFRLFPVARLDAGVLLVPGMSRRSGSMTDAVAAPLMPPLASGLNPNGTGHAIDTTKLFGTRTLRRLRAVRKQVDPDGMFQANHSVPTAA